MKILLRDEHPTVANAVEKANFILRDAEFYQEIRKKERFDMSTATPGEIASYLETLELLFEVILFKPQTLFERIKYRKTYAYTDHNYPNMLFINELKLEREEESIAATIIHESIHALDHAVEDYTFGHGSNRAHNKENTAPYWIGNLAYKILTNDPNKQIAFNEMVSEIVITDSAIS